MHPGVAFPLALWLMRVQDLDGNVEEPNVQC
jgi:hypothetical protein